MDTTPIVIPVSELRRELAGLIGKAHRSPVPVYITQRGYITAVLLTPQKYEDLRDAARSEQERRLSARRLDDRRTLIRTYGPLDWETGRLMGDDGGYDEQGYAEGDRVEGDAEGGDEEVRAEGASGGAASCW